MPMQRERYPDDWEEIALAIKTEANWKCQECGRECRRTGEALHEFIDRVVGKIHSKSSEDLRQEINRKPGRFVLTVAHLDHVPENCDRANLKALCSVCHCRYDLKAMAHKKRLKREYHGQQRLFDL